MRSLALVAVSLCMLLLSACDIELFKVPDVHPYRESRYASDTPGIYVDGRLIAYMKEVLTAYVPDGEFSELAIELTASNPPSSSSVSQSVNSSLSLPNPTDPLPPGDVLWQPWWNLVPGWRLTTPNKVIISFFHDPTWEFETILGAAFSAFAASQSAETAFPAGITVSDALTQRLATLWDETKICSGYPQGEFGDLAVYLMPPVFPCGDEACSGYFSAQNLLKTGDQEWIVKHEFIHYLLWRNTGDADGSHTNSLFKDCVFD